MRPWLVVFTAGAFFFYSFIQMTLFSTVAMQEYFMKTLSLDSPAEFGNFAGTFLWGTVLFLIPIGVLRTPHTDPGDMPIQSAQAVRLSFLLFTMFRFLFSVNGPPGSTT